MSSTIRRLCLFAATIGYAMAGPSEKPTVPTLCTAENQGRCDCGNLRQPSFGLQTYTWWILQEQRCYTTHARRSSEEKKPVVIYLNCYGRDKVVRNPKLLATVRNAERFGMHVVYASSPQGSWSWHSAISNKTNPTTCDSVAGGNDFTYFEDIFAHLPTSLPDYNPDQVFAFGFSQNGMGAGYVGSCFQNKVTGAWRGGAGLFLKDGSGGPVPPNKEGTCDSCSYWPNYPCFQGKEKLPLRDCAMDYDNDPITAFNASDNHPMGLYQKSLLEGGDARILIFKSKEHPPGGHKPPAYEMDWAMACMGLRDKVGQCSSGCVSALKKCVASNSDYGSCMGIYGQSPDPDVARSCHVGCTPTWEMLTQSEVPFLHTTNENGFGVPSKQVCKNSQPTTSICTVDPSKVKSCPSGETLVV